MTGAATLKLRLTSSVAVLRSQRSAERRPAGPQRFSVGMHTCLQYAGPTPMIRLNARNAIYTVFAEAPAASVGHRRALVLYAGTCHSRHDYTDQITETKWRTGKNISRGVQRLIQRRHDLSLTGILRVQTPARWSRSCLLAAAAPLGGVVGRCPGGGRWSDTSR